MKITKKCGNTQTKISIKEKLDELRNRRRSSAGMFYTSSAGAVTSLILTLAQPFIFSLTGTTNTYATTSTITISVASSVGLNIASTSTTGTFATSDTTTNNISISTDNGTGYTLGIKASTEGSNALTKSGGGSIPSHTVSAGISESTYRTDSTYNNTWGFRPSKLNSQANSNYLPGPTSASTLVILDQTSSANSNANNYNLAIGARINSNTAPGTYGNTFVITVTANPVNYSITYNANATGVSNMPPNVSNQPTDTEQVNISSTVPTRDGYNFKGWCTAQTTDGGTCSGTTYNPDGGGTALAWAIDQTQASNSLNLYAMWASAGPVITNTTCATPVPSSITYMQELADSAKKSAALSSMTQGSQYYLVDERDNQGYCVAKQADGNIWMTQNLDLDIGGTGVATLTSENTDLNTSGSAPYADGYSSSGGVITWSPASTATTSGRTISGTTVSPEMPTTTEANSTPYSAEGGDRYYYTTGTTSNETMQTLAQCTAAGHSEEDCAHYHAGNYYNWTAAIASNASSGIGSTRYDVAANSICPKGWKLPQGRSSTSGDAATRQFGNLWYTSGIITSVSGSSYATNGFNNIRTSPLFFVRGGYVYGSSLVNSGSFGFYWSSSVVSTSDACSAYFRSSLITSANYSTRSDGLSIRCVVR